MATRLRSFVGLQRLSAGVSPTLTFATLSAREDFKAIQTNFNKLIRQVQNITPLAVAYSLDPIFERSQELVPVDTGELKASGYLEVRRVGDDTIAEIGYGKGGHPFYAPYVHEDLMMRHDPPTQAKFLEQAINEGLEDVLPRVVEYMRG
jgi:hypothetical protein